MSTVKMVALELKMVIDIWLSHDVWFQCVLITEVKLKQLGIFLTYVITYLS